jgi:hypothetical protein
VTDRERFHDFCAFRFFTLQQIGELPKEFNQITQGITNAITETRANDRQAPPAPIVIQTRQPVPKLGCSIPGQPSDHSYWNGNGMRR